MSSFVYLFICYFLKRITYLFLWFLFSCFTFCGFCNFICFCRARRICIKTNEQKMELNILEDKMYNWKIAVKLLKKGMTISVTGWRDSPSLSSRPTREQSNFSINLTSDGLSPLESELVFIRSFDEGLSPKRQSHLYSVVLEFYCVILYLSDSTSHTSIFRLFPISSDVCKGYRPETSVIFLLLGAGIFLCYSISIR